mmetsp:Transcript_21691/g.35850  ORF Transcript_21691/g.35850 Transcript_21691/m.35850 type:complete len:108 (-) Transcript_21691:137-460(-)
MLSNRSTELHLFSEDYGLTNWSAYQEVVDEWHLAKKGSDNQLDVLLRDWAHFVDADVLIVGGTLSAVPALARDEPSTTSSSIGDPFPMTLYWAVHHGYFDQTRFVPS